MHPYQIAVMPLKWALEVTAEFWLTWSQVYRHVH